MVAFNLQEFDHLIKESINLTKNISNENIDERLFNQIKILSDYLKNSNLEELAEISLGSIAFYIALNDFMNIPFIDPNDNVLASNLIDIIKIIGKLYNHKKVNMRKIVSVHGAAILNKCNIYIILYLRRHIFIDEDLFNKTLNGFIKLYSQYMNTLGLKMILEHYAKDIIYTRILDLRTISPQVTLKYNIMWYIANSIPKNEIIKNFFCSIIFQMVDIDSNKIPLLELWKNNLLLNDCYIQIVEAYPNDILVKSNIFKDIKIWLKLDL